MSNHPNMSYCMFQNTQLAMRQILNHMADAEQEGELGAFFSRLSREEKRAARWLVESCNNFVEIFEQAEEEEAKDIEGEV